MPIYSFECASCKKVFDELMRLNDCTVVMRCRCCGKPARKVVTAFSPAVFKPYWHHNLAKDPIYIKSRKQERHEFESRQLADAR